MRFAVLINAFALDVLQDKVRMVIFHRTRVEQSCDMRMGQPSEQSAFASKSVDDAYVSNRSVEDFDCDISLEAAVSTRCAPYFPHASDPAICLSYTRQL